VLGVEVPAFPRIQKIFELGCVVATEGGTQSRVEKGQTTGNWSLMGIIGSASGHRLAVFEDFTKLDGHQVYADEDGVLADLPKSAEPTSASAAGLYHGHKLEDVLKSESDLLSQELLAGRGDPDYAEVAACFSPLVKMYTYTFVGTPNCPEKVGVFYGGSTPN